MVAIIENKRIKMGRLVNANRAPLGALKSSRPGVVRFGERNRLSVHVRITG